MTGPVPEHPEIIRRPDLQPRTQRWVFRTFTVLAWTVWIYLFLPLLGLLLWALGIERFLRLIIVPGTQGQMLALFAFVGILAAAALVIVGWSRFSAHRARTAPRPDEPRPVTDTMTCERFRITPDMLETIRSNRIIVLHIDDKGDPVEVEPRHLPIRS